MALENGPFTLYSLQLQRLRPIFQI